MKECTGVKPLCPNGKNAVCNTNTGEWECPAIIAEKVEQDNSDIDGDEQGNGND